MNVGIRDLDKVNVLLYSFKQGCFHVETLDETIVCGLNAYARGSAFQDYIVLAVAADRKQLDELRDELVSKYGRYEPQP